MKDLREIIAENIQSLRVEAEMTQAALAEKLNYTDKAVSKWERAEALPDITVLKQIADLFGVTVDYLLRYEHTAQEEHQRKTARLTARNRFVISAISTLGVTVLATLIFVLLLAFGRGSFAPWLVYIYSLPISLVVVLVFNSIWGKRRLNFIIISLLLWSILVALYLSLLVLLGVNFWLIFIIGIPAEVLILFVPGITVVKKKKASAKEE